MHIYAEKVQKIAVGGTFSENKRCSGICRHIVVKPTTETTFWDMTIVDENDAMVYERKSEQGTLSELLTMPMRGIYTVTVTNATADEAFLVEIILEEAA